MIALRVLNSLSSDDLPDLALELLPLGESSSAAALAGATPADTPSDRASLFDRALLELGLQLPSRLEAAVYLKRVFASDAVSGALAPEAAAKLILELYDDLEFELPRGPFIGSGLGAEEIFGLYYAFDGVESHSVRADLERQLLEALAAIAHGGLEP